MFKELFEYSCEADQRDAVNRIVDPSRQFAKIEVGCYIGGSTKRADNVFLHGGRLYANECKLSWNDHQHAVGQAKGNADVLSRHKGQHHSPSVTYNSVPPKDVLAWHRKEGVRVFVIRDEKLHDVTEETTIEPVLTREELRENCISHCGYNIDSLFGDNKVLMPVRLMNLMFDTGVSNVDWQDPNVVFADIGAGTGTFVIEAIGRKFKAQEKLVADEPQRIKNVVKQVRFNDIRLDMASVFAKQCLFLWGHLGLTEQDLRKITTHKDALELTRERLMGNNYSKMSLIIVGNPPYNGISFDQIKDNEELRSFSPNGNSFRSHYAFMAMERKLLKDGEKMIFVTPHKWLTEGSAKHLREEMFNDGKLAYLEVMPQPEEWKDVQTGQVAVFVFEKGRKEHAPSVFCTADGRFPNASTNEQRDLLRKVLSVSGKRVQLVPGCVSRKGWNSNDPSLIETDWYDYARGGAPVKKHERVKLSESRLAILRSQKGKKIIVSSSFTNVPLRDVRGTIDVTPFSELLVGIVTDKPIAMITLTTSNVAKLVFSSFFDSKNFDKALNKLLPDITSLLPDNPTEDDVNNAFGLTPKEIQLVNDLAKTYGKDM